MRRAATLGDEITRRGLTNAQAAVLGGVQPSTVLRIVKGQVRAKPITVVNLAKGLGIGALRMKAMCDAHWYAAHPEEDLSGGGRHAPPRNARRRPPADDRRPRNVRLSTTRVAQNVARQSVNPAAAAYSLAQLPARMAALLKPADRERLAARVRELDELAELMRQPGGLAEAPAPAPLHRAGQGAHR